MKTKATILLLLSILCIQFIQAKAPGRPKNVNGVLVTDKGCMLRGTRVWVNRTNERTAFATGGAATEFKSKYNMNCLNVGVWYRPDSKGQPGIKKADEAIPNLDKVVQKAAEQGMYVSILYNSLGNIGDYNLLKDFWNKVSKRYANETHVIFQPINEPKWGYNGDQKRGEIYNIIRSNAPNSMIVLLNLAGGIRSVSDYDEMIKSIEKESGKKIDWQKNAIGFHHYGGKDASTVRKKYPVVMTEGNYTDEKCKNDPKSFISFEQQQVSWFFLGEAVSGDSEIDCFVKKLWAKTSKWPFDCNGNVNTPPSAKISSPSPFATFSKGDNVKIKVNATDSDGSISKVIFYNGNSKLGENNSSPWEYTWNNISNGKKTIKVEVVDNKGAKAYDEIVIIVDDPSKNDPPSVAFTNINPEDEFWSNEFLEMNAIAADPDGKVVKVEFYHNSSKIGEDPTAPYEFTWTKPKPADNTLITLKVKAIDDEGASGESSVQVRIWNRGSPPNSSNKKPSISLTSPSNNSKFDEGSTITLKANASDTDGSIKKVEFYSGNTKLGEDSKSPFEYKWNNVSQGNYSVYAKAFDNENASGSSDAINIEVKSSGSGNPDPNPNPSNSILFVVGSTTLKVGDKVLKSSMEALGFEVVTFNAKSVKSSDASNHQLVLISATVGSGDVSAKFKDIKVPVIVNEPYIFDDMQMTDATAGSEYGFLDDEKSLKILTNHPISKGLNLANVDVLSVSNKIAYGNPSNSADKIAQVSNGSYAIFAYEKGDAMYGMNAPAKRIGFYTLDDAPSFWNSNGEKLFTNAICWATGKCDDLVTLQLPQNEFEMTASPNPTSGKVSFSQPFESVQIMNLSGVVITELTCNSSYVDLSNLPKGIYMMKVQSVNGIDFFKILKR